MEEVAAAQEQTALTTTGLAESARRYARAARAPKTLAGYQRDWQRFERWCRTYGREPLPASPDTVALYLTARADAGRKAATLARELAAIGFAHRAMGAPNPAANDLVREQFAGIRRTIGTAQRQVEPLLPAQLRAISHALPTRLIGIRDRAMLLLGFAGAFRRSELAALAVEDLRFTDDGLEVLLRRSKTDQEAAGLKKGIPPGSDPASCPVRSMRLWLEASGIEAGPLFREITRHGRLGKTALDPRSIARIVKRAIEGIGLDAREFSGHSLRAGLATASAKAGKSLPTIMRQTGHKNTNTVMRYIRAAALFEDNAAAGIGL